VTRVAAIDCGTNSIRLLVADVDPRAGTLVDLDRRMEVVRLGQDVDRTGRIAPEALERTLDAARRYHRVCVDLGVEAIRFVATSASRDAENRADFVDGVRDAMGVEPEVVVGTEEAELSFRGATGVLSAALPGPFLVVDLGGGSTELVLGTDRPEASYSMDVGCVRLTERHLRTDPPTDDEIARSRRDVAAALDEAAAVVPLGRTVTLVGLAGTVTTVAAVELGLPEYDAEKIHGFRLTRAAVEDVFRTFATETAEQRASNPGLEPGRVDVIVGGTAVLAGMLRQLEFDEVLVSESDILDGLVRSQL